MLPSGKNTKGIGRLTRKTLGGLQSTACAVVPVNKHKNIIEMLCPQDTVSQHTAQSFTVLMCTALKRENDRKRETALADILADGFTELLLI